MGTAPRVGVLYQPALGDFIDFATPGLDYVEVIPDTVWTDHGRGTVRRFSVAGEDRARLESYRSRTPVLLHGIGLSIGSDEPLDLDYVEQVRRWCDWLDVPWYSEHLAYSRTAEADKDINAGLTLPLPLDGETVDLVGPKVRQLSALLGRDVLLENNVYYFPAVGEDLGEAEVLNRLCRDWASWILLDVHNLYVNVRNGVVDADSCLTALDLDRVREVHVAGGMEIDGFYVDAHSGAPPEEVWSLLSSVAAACPRLEAVTFELLGSWAPALGSSGLAEVVERARACVDDPSRVDVGKRL